MRNFAEVRNNYEFEGPPNGIKSGITIDVGKIDSDDKEGKLPLRSF